MYIVIARNLLRRRGQERSRPSSASTPHVMCLDNEPPFQAPVAGICSSYGPHLASQCLQGEGSWLGLNLCFCDTMYEVGDM